MRDQLLAAYAKVAESRGTALADTALRARSLEGRDLLSYLTTGGEDDYDSLLSKVTGENFSESLDPSWLGQLAKVVAFQSILESDLADAISLLEALHLQSGISGIPSELAKIFAETLWIRGEFKTLSERLDELSLEADDRVIVETDMHNPFVRPLGRNSHSNWIRHFTRAMGFDPNNPNELVSADSADGGDSPFDRLRAESGIPVDDGPLVTVLVTTYRPGNWLFTTLRSLASQTWRNLEILIVDDGSPDGYEDELQSAKAIDDRITIIRAPKNSGTYVARNLGIGVAHGEFITFQDSDDWSHPLRIERQIRPMLDEPDVVMTTSTYVRTDDNLVLTRLGYPLHRRNVSSLMFRTDPVLPTVGFMDQVRKGADAEYLSRIQTVFPDGYRHLGPPALAVIRSMKGSLSHGEARPGWHHMGRFAYRSAFEDWHREISHGASPYVAQIPEIRPFPSPRSYVDDMSPGVFDFVVVADWRPREGDLEMISELRSLCNAGLRVGFAQVETFRHMSRRRREQLSEALRALERDGRVTFVMLDDKVSVDTVVVRDPTVLQFPPHDPAHWDAGTVRLVDPGRSRLKNFYRKADVEKQAQRIFGCYPIWLAKRRWRSMSKIRSRLSRLRPGLGR